MTSKEKRQLVAWGRQALHGLDHSTVFVGVLDDHPLDAARLEFTLQIGHALLTGKPIIVPVPHGVAIPAQLEAAAAAIVRYHPNDPQTLTAGLVQALTRLGINRQ